MLLKHKENEVLRTGSYKQLYSAHNVIAYGRFSMDDAVIIVVNNGEDELRVNIPGMGDRTWYGCRC